MICGSVGEVVRDMCDGERVAGERVKCGSRTCCPKNHVWSSELGTKHQHGLLASRPLSDDEVVPVHLIDLLIIIKQTLYVSR